MVQQRQKEVLHISLKTIILNFKTIRKNGEKYACINIRAYRKFVNSWVLKTNHLGQITASHAADPAKLLDLSVLQSHL